MKLSTVEITVSMIGWKRWRLRRSHPSPRARARVRPLHADFVLFDAAIRILLGVPFRSQPTKTLLVLNTVSVLHRGALHEQIVSTKSISIACSYSGCFFNGALAADMSLPARE